MQIPANRLDLAFCMHQQEYEQKALEVLRSGFYVMGRELAAFESEFAAFTGGQYCVGLASGLDALWIAFRLLGIGVGDEVIVQGNTYIASVMGITINGATPVFAEPNERFGIDADRIEALITPRTKAILVTHLYGMMTPMNKITQICRTHGLKLVEDCAQAHGASYAGRMAGTFGDVGCFSFYPTKNLGCFGDGGAVIVKDAALAEAFRVFRNYGSEKKYCNSVVGANSRLDELQAGLLRVRLRYMEELTAEKSRLARRYAQGIRNAQIRLPEPAADTVNVWHQYVIRCERRQALIDNLRAKGIGTQIHYPIPPHLSQAYRYLGLRRGSLPVTEHLADTVLSLPIYFGMTQKEQDYVIRALNAFE
ncbi:MAG: DegT/DnrJ/EryC1/StrS family aminotransferase [Clostridia bacterium]|nr:DegT/DnrJ/EryC1/StrS family aminotransferase [Clostridia bacterium]